MESSTLDRMVNNLAKELNLAEENIVVVKEAMKDYALYVSLDSKVRKELMIELERDVKL